jgi:hypothetical protein
MIHEDNKTDTPSKVKDNDNDQYEEHQKDPADDTPLMSGSINESSESDNEETKESY